VKVSSRGEYALRALIYLGQRQGNVVSIQEISEKTMVPAQYLEQILLQLKKCGYVVSKRGIRGGYSLSQTPACIRIGEVVRKLEGPLAPMGCASITAYDPCSLEAGCLLKPLWVLVRDTVAALLDQTTLEDLLTNRVPRLTITERQG
jgi:Rrf2 family protein